MWGGGGWKEIEDVIKQMTYCKTKIVSCEINSEAWDET